MNEPTFRRELIAELKGIRAALDAANRADPLAMIAEALGEGATPQTGVESAEGPIEHFPGVLAVYRHPAGEGWRIVASKDAGEPGGWYVRVERA